MVNMNFDRYSELADAWTAGNNNGLGYAPYADEVGDTSIDAAVLAAKADGWEVVWSADNSSEITILTNADGEHMGIGGDGRGFGAWAVDLDAAMTIEN